MRTPVPLVLTAVLAFGADADAQPAAHPDPKITVRALGGFMGFSEGFCENPGGQYDWPKPDPPQPRLHPCLDEPTDKPINKEARWLGGAIGAARLLASRDKTADDWLVLVPNNKSVEEDGVFLQHLLKLRADAIAIGGEDIERLLRGPAASARRIVDWVTSNPALPLLATNAAVRTTKLQAPDKTDAEINGIALTP